MGQKRTSKLFDLGCEWNSSCHVMTKSFGLSDLWVTLREAALVKVRNFQGSWLVGTRGGSCFVSMPPQDTLSHVTLEVVLVVRVKFTIFFEVIPFILVNRYQTFDGNSISVPPNSWPSSGK